MALYSYEGPILEFGKCINPNWKAQTQAPSEEKARSNLAYRYKMENGKTPNSSIRLTGKIVEIS